MTHTSIALAFLASCAATRDRVPDAPTTNPEKYHVLLETPRVRVIEYRDRPGDRTAMHHHPAFVLYAFAPFTRRITFPDGRSTTRSFQAGETVAMDAQTHVGENIGTTDTHALLVELR